MDKLQFCSKCDFMYYLRINKENEDKPEYYCRVCGNIDDELTKGVCVLNTKSSTRKINPNSSSKYSILDIRNPHIYNIPCPNVDCNSNKSKDISPDIIYKRYNDDDMKYIYTCVHCKNEWETNNIT